MPLLSYNLFLLVSQVLLFGSASYSCFAAFLRSPLFALLLTRFSRLFTFTFVEGLDITLAPSFLGLLFVFLK